MPVGTEPSPAERADLGPGPWSLAVSRRGFLGLAAAAAGLLAEPGMRRARGEPPPTLERLHRPLLRLPAFTSNGARVPVTVEVAHPMEADDHVTALQVVNARDPVPVKGTFHFTPTNGRVYVAFQARFDEGPSAVMATAECRRHGRFTTTAPIAIAEGGGGCAGGAPPAARIGADEIRPPVIRIPQLIAEGLIRPGDIIDVQVKTRHPNRTGLVVRDGKFVQDSEPFHLNEMEVFYGGEQVSRFALSAALSDNPLITFKLLARREATVRVTLTNTRGQRFEATHPLRLA
jgi:desulfoferrodoxin (superoxide reductase-like protein)